MNKILASLIILFCCAILPATADADARAHTVFQSGLSDESALRVYEAIDTFREAIALDSTNAGYREHYAWYLHFNGFPEEAVVAFGDALVLKPGDVALTKGKAWNLKLIGRWKESYELYRALYGMETSPDSLAIAAAQVKSLLSAENDSKIASLTDQLARSPGNPVITRELFRTLGYQGQSSTALSLGAEILAVSPQDLPFKLEYARMLSWNGQREKASGLYRDLMRQSPDNPFLMLESALVMADNGQPDEALKLLGRAGELRPGAARILRAEAEILARVGKKSEAVATADAIAKDGNPGLERALARSRSRHFSGLLDEAVREYSLALASYPHHPDLLWGLSECAVYSNAPDIAGKAIADWKAVSPDDARREKYGHAVRKALAPRAVGSFQLYKNSSDFGSISAGLSTEARISRAFSLMADAHESRFSQTGYRDIYRESLGAGVKYRPLPGLELIGRIGGNIYNRGDDSVVGMAGMTWRLQPGWQVAAAWDRIDIIDTEPVFGNAIYNHVVTIGSVGSRISSDEYSLYLQRDLLSGRLALSGKVVIGDYSDGNLKQSRYAGISYRLLEVPRLAVGYQYFFLNYRNPAPAYNEGTNSTSAYYDPANFEVHTLFADISHQISKAIRAGLVQRVSSIPKSDGIAYAAFGSLEADLSSSVSTALTYRFFHQNKGIDRYSQSGHFSAQQLLVELTVLF